MRPDESRAKLMARSAAVFFEDVVGAFDSIVREFIFDFQPSDEAIAHLFAKLRLPRDDFDAFVEAVSQPSSKLAGMHPHLVEIMVEAHMAT